MRGGQRRAPGVAGDGWQKNAAVVFADCDFQVAVDTLTRLCFENAGQVCLGTERVYVERPIFEKLVTALQERARNHDPGHPEDKATKIGPVISKEHQQKVLGLYAKARRGGATIVTGGGVPDMPAHLKGRLLGRSPPSDRPERDGHRGHRGNFRPLLPHQPVRQRGRGAGQGQRQPLWSGDPDLYQDISRANRLAQQIEVGCAGSTSGFCATCARRSAVPSNRA